MVIFIDEIEVLLGSRGGSYQSDFKDTKIAEFLTAWDGFHKTDSSTIVIGATNRKEMLDDAILRRLPIKLGVDQNNLLGFIGPHKYWLKIGGPQELRSIKHESKAR